jgi:hypothetical protein
LDNFHFKRNNKKHRVANIIFLLCISILVFFPAVHCALADEVSSPTSQKPLATPNQENKLGGQYTFYGDLGGRINPRGLVFLGGINYRNRYRYDEKYDVVSAYWQTGLGLGVSPAALQANLHFEWMPWVFLPLRLQYDYYQYTGSNSALLSFNSANSPYGDDVRDNRHDEEMASGHRFLFQPTLQGKFDRFIIRNQTDVAFFRFSGRGPYFLEIGQDILLKDSDFLFSNRTQLLYSIYPDNQNKKLLVGPYYEIAHAREAGITQQKLGLSFYWEPAASFRYIGRPHLGAIIAVHLEDPNRQGQLYFLMGAGFEYTLQPKSR